MQNFKREQGQVSFKDDRNNPLMERTSVLSTALTNAEVLALDLRAQQQAIRAAMTDAVVARLRAARERER